MAQPAWMANPVLGKEALIGGQPAAPGQQPAATSVGGALSYQPGTATREPGTVTGELTTQPKGTEDTFHTATQAEKLAKNLDPNTDYKINDRTGEPSSIPKAAKDEEDVTKGDVQRVNTIKALAANARKLYEQNIKGQPVERGFGLTEYLPTPKNQTFTDAGNAILPLIRPLIAQSAKQGDSNVELLIFQSYVPKASDSDEAIENKFRMLDTLVDGVVGGKAPSELLAQMGIANPGDLPADATANQPGAATSEAGPQPGPAQLPTGAQGPAAGIETPQAGVTYDAAGHPIDKATGRVILEDQGYGVAQGSDTGIVGEKGGTHTINNPAWAGVNATVNAMVKGGATDDDLVALLRSKGYPDTAIFGDGQALQDFQKARAWLQDKGKGYKGNFHVDLEQKTVDNSTWQNMVGSDVGAGVTGAVDAASAFSIDNVAGLLGKDPAEVRFALDQSRTAHPKSTAVGNIVGGVGAAAGLSEAAIAAGAPEGAAAMAAGDIGYGTAAGGMATDVNPETGAPATAWDRTVGAAKGALGAAIGSAGGQVIGGPVRAAGREATGPALVLNEAGIPTTVGAQYGGWVKKAEDWIAGQPFLADVVGARQAESIRRFNERIFDGVLKPLGLKNKPGLVGNDAVEFAQEQISKQYKKALDGKVVALDDDFQTSYAKAFSDAEGLPTIGKELSARVKKIVDPRMADDALSGEDMQRISQQLQMLKSSYYTNPMKMEIGDAVDAVEESIFGTFRRQAKEVLPEYNKAKTAQRKLFIANEAVLKADNNKEQIFMPSQLRSVDKRAAERTAGKIAAGKGKREFGKLSKAAQELLPRKMPDSGTARLVIPSVLLGTGAAAEAGGAATGHSPGGKALALGVILAGAYTRAGQRFLTKPGRGASGPIRRAVSGKVGSGIVHGAAVAAQEKATAEAKAAGERKRAKAK